MTFSCCHTVVVVSLTSILTNGPNLTTGQPYSRTAVVGSSTTLSCPVADDQRSMFCWRHGVSILSTDFVFAFGSLTNEYASRMNVEFRNNTSLLIINAVQLDDGGFYFCHMCTNNDFRITELIVFDPVCSMRTSINSPMVDEFDPVDITCEIEYRGSWTPDIQCLTDRAVQLNVTSESVTNSTSQSVTYRKTIVATSNIDGVVFTCRADKHRPPNIADQNVPGDVLLWTSQLVRVSYGARKVTISSPNNITLRPGDVLNCTAEGNPQPTYHWIDTATNLTIGWSSALSLSCSSFKGAHTVNKAAMCVATVVNGPRTTVSSSVITFHFDGECQWVEGTVCCEHSVCVYGVVAACLAVAIIVLVVSLRRRHITNCRLGNEAKKRHKPDVVPVVPVYARVCRDRQHPTADDTTGSASSRQITSTAATTDKIPEIPVKQDVNSTTADQFQLDRHFETSSYAEIRMSRNPRRKPRQPGPSCQQSTPPDSGHYASVDHTRNASPRHLLKHDDTALDGR